jgi:hypothetical protein
MVIGIIAGAKLILILNGVSWSAKLPHAYTFAPGGVDSKVIIASSGPSVGVALGWKVTWISGLTIYCRVGAAVILRVAKGILPGVRFTADTVPMRSMHKKAQNSTRFMVDSSLHQQLMISNCETRSSDGHGSLARP